MALFSSALPFTALYSMAVFLRARLPILKASLDIWTPVEMRRRLDAQTLLERAILFGDVEGVENSITQGAKVLIPIEGGLPVCVAILNGEEDIAINLLRHHPSDNLVLRTPPPAPSKSLSRCFIPVSPHRTYNNPLPSWRISGMDRPSSIFDSFSVSEDD